MSEYLKILKLYEEHPEFLGVKIKRADQVGHTSETPLHIASRQGRYEHVSLFLKNGVNINLKGDCGNTALHEAAMRGHIKVVSLLLENGAEVSIKNDLDFDPRQVAIIANHLDTAKILES